MTPTDGGDRWGVLHSLTGGKTAVVQWFGWHLGVSMVWAKSWKDEVFQKELPGARGARGHAKRCLAVMPRRMPQPRPQEMPERPGGQELLFSESKLWWIHSR